MNPQVPAAPTTGVAEILALDQKNLEADRYRRAALLPGIVLQEQAGKIADQTVIIESIIDGDLKAKEKEKALLGIITSEIRRNISECVTSCNYTEKNGSQQLLYVFLGTHWAEIPTQLYYDFIRNCCKKMGVMSLFYDDPDFMNKVFERVAFMVSNYRPNVFPKGDVWINLQNGTLEIHNDGELKFREHRAEDFFLYCLNYSYNPKARCTRWRKFLDQVLPDKDTQRLLGEYIGYCFTRDLKLEKMAVFYGTGSNGKSVILDMVELLFGRSNISNIALSALTTDAEKRALLENKLANISHESNCQIDNAMMKQLVSGEPTDARVLYQGTHTMQNYAKFFTSFNKLPRTEHTFGWFRRWLLFPFKVTISEEEQDHDLTKKLKKELPGILNWVLRNLTTLVQNRSFSDCEVCNNALQDYKKQSNSGLVFLDSCCIIPSDTRTSLKELYFAYGRFCYDEGITTKFKKSTFKEVLESVGLKPETTHGKIMYNVKLKEDEGLE